MAQCRICSAIIPRGATECPLCAPDAPGGSDEVYELSTTEDPLPPEWEGGAIYTMELPARCPHCQERVRTLRVLRMKRTQVTFTSPLPRGGRVVICSACDGILSADLS